MNIHHLELFYYVAKHRGIMQGVRAIPYGIQQPAVSGQLLKLERFLGTRLFNRRPFALTPAGQELFQFITPFFSNLGFFSEKLRDGTNQHLRIAGASTVLRDHYPELLENMQREFPQLKLTLRELNQVQAEVLILNQEIDLAISVWEREASRGIHTALLLQLPMTLILKRNKNFTSLGSFSSEMTKYPLISISSDNTLGHLFQEELKKRNISWAPMIEVESLDLVRAYVTRGFGIGLTVAIPKISHAKDIREIPLKGFPKLRIGAFWQGELSILSKRFLELVKARAKKLIST